MSDAGLPQRLVAAARRRWIDAQRWETIVFALVVLPIVAAFVRSLADGWIPMGEDAIMAMRARDVFTANHPFLGTFSSASLTSGTTVNHPGPLLFDVLALPVRLFGSGPGVALGVAIVNVVGVVVACRAALHSAGRVAFVWVAAGALALEWTLGSSLLIDPWNPHVVLLPFYAMLVCTIAFVGGQRWTLAWVIGFGSFALQTHVSYALLVPVVVVFALAAAWWRDRRRTADERSSSEPWRPAVIVAAVWGVALWSQPLWQQLFGSGPGNLTALLQSGSDGQEHAGLGIATRLVAQVTVLPPTWWRPSFLDSLQDLRLRDATGAPATVPSWVPSATTAVISLGLLVVGLGVLAAWAVRRRRWDHVAAPVLAIVLLAVACQTAAQVPAGGYGVAPHQLRWLWPITVLWMVVAGEAATRALLPRLRASTRSTQPARWAVGVVLLVVAVAGCGRYEPRTGVARAPGSMSSVEDVVAQVRRSSFPPALLDGTGLWIGEPYTAPILEGLYHDDRSTAIVRVERQQAAQVGLRREVTPDVTARLFLRSGAAALECGADESRIALTSPLDDAAVMAVEASQREVIAIAARLGADLDPALYDIRPDLRDRVATDASVADWVMSGAFAVDAAGLDLELYLAPDERADIAAYEAARAPLGIDTVAVFIGRRDVDVPVDLVGIVPGSRVAACPPA